MIDEIVSVNRYQYNKVRYEFNGSYAEWAKYQEALRESAVLEIVMYAIKTKDEDTLIDYMQPDDYDGMYSDSAWRILKTMVKLLLNPPPDVETIKRVALDYINSEPLNVEPNFVKFFSYLDREVDNA